jgi:hypothetical protein
MSRSYAASALRLHGVKWDCFPLTFTPDTIANVCHSSLDELPLMRCGKKLELGFGGMDSGCKKSERVCGGAYGEYGGVCVWC